MNNKNEIKDNSLKILFTIIIVIILLSLIIPIIYQIFILGNDVYSIWDNSVWGGFLGSLWGGSIGGIGTLIAVYFTTRETRKIQNRNEIMRTDDKKLEEKKERIIFTNRIVEDVAKYITYISLYFYNCNIIKNLEKDLESFENQLMNIQKDKIDLNLNTPKEEDSDFINKAMDNESKMNNLSIKEDGIIYKINNKKLEIQQNKADRTIANECYFVLDMKLSNIDIAKDLLEKLNCIHNELHEKDTKWMESKIVELKNVTEKFKNYYVG